MIGFPSKIELNFFPVLRPRKKPLAFGSKPSGKDLPKKLPTLKGSGGKILKIAVSLKYFPLTAPGVLPSSAPPKGIPSFLFLPQKFSSISITLSHAKHNNTSAISSIRPFFLFFGDLPSDVSCASFHAFQSRNDNKTPFHAMLQHFIFRQVVKRTASFYSLRYSFRQKPPMPLLFHRANRNVFYSLRNSKSAYKRSASESSVPPKDRLLHARSRCVSAYQVKTILLP